MRKHNTPKQPSPFPVVFMYTRIMRIHIALLAGLYCLAPAAFGATENKTELATFAGGCFWSMQNAFDTLKGQGVLGTTVGYTGGTKPNPTYDEVCDGNTGHAESVEVRYDPSKISYEKLLDVYWHHIDPTASNAQFCDEGNQYRSAIFYHGAYQRKLAQLSKESLLKSGRFKKPIMTEIVQATKFYPAEEYHQEYAQKNPLRYKAYRVGCGRDKKLREIWGNDAPSH
jgi:peptide-methionine (S)-S-oxide reductase